MCTTAICRLCLSNERLTYSISNTVLQNLWEKLTNSRFDTSNGRPLLACYMCHAHLIKSHELMQRALKAEELFKKFINNTIEESKNLVSLIVNRANEIDYNYAMEQQYNVDIKRPTNKLEEDNVNYLVIKKEGLDLETFTNETETAVEIEYNEYNIKKEVEDFPDSNHAETEYDVQTEILTKGLDTNMSFEDIREDKVQIVLETDNEGMPMRKRKLDDVAQNVTLIKFEDTSEDRKTSPNSVTSNIFIQTNNKDNARNVIQQNMKRRNSKISNLNKEKKIFKQRSPKSASTAPSTSLDKSDEETKIRIKKGSENDFSRQYKCKKAVEKPYLCMLCDYRCTQKSYLVRHIQSKHTGEKPYICDLCGFRCREKGNLKSHMQYKHIKEKKFSCHLCKYECVEKNSLNKHLRIHTGEKPFACELCELRFSHKFHLNDHIRYKHTLEKNFSCHICQYRCVKKSYLKVHLYKHTGEKPYICEVCDYRCSRKDNLKAHIQYKHTKEKKFSCHICQSQFARKDKLTLHLRTH